MMTDRALTIGLFADAHVAGSDSSSRTCSHSLDKLAVAIDTFIDRKVDMIVNLGDMLDRVDGDPTDPADNLAAAAAIVRRFGGPHHFVLGNHDLDCLTKANLVAQSGAVSPTPRYAFDHGPFRFIVLDTNRFEDGSDYSPDNMPDDWGDSWLGQRQLAWLAEELKRAGDTPTIILTHAELDERFGEDAENGEDLHVAKDAAGARALIESAANVRLVLQGHNHAGRFREFANIPYLTLSAMCEGPFPQSNAYAILHLAPNGAVHLEGFADQPSFP